MYADAQTVFDHAGNLADIRNFHLVDSNCHLASRWSDSRCPIGLSAEWIPDPLEIAMLRNIVDRGGPPIRCPMSRGGS